MNKELVIYFLRKVKRVMTWWPSELFYQTHYKWHEYETPSVSIFGVDDGYTIENKTYTKLGKMFYDNPPIIEIIKLPYYMVTIPIFIITNLTWFMFETWFLTRKFSKMI